MRGICLLRRFVDRRASLNLGSIPSSFSPPTAAINVPSPPTCSIPLKPLFCNDFSTHNIIKPQFSFHSLQLQRTLCSSPDNSDFTLINSEEQFNTMMKTVQEKSMPAIFYFTAAWCGPCKFISPIIAEESKKYPDVTVHKIDIDQESLGKVLSELNISAVPTLYFFQDGKKAAVIVGADVQELKATMNDLYA